MEFDLRLKNEDVTLTNADGVQKEFVMYEATGTQRDLQQKFVQERQKDMNDMRGIKEHFLGMLLKYKETNQPVGAEFFINVPGRIRDQLFELAQQLCGMKTEAEILKLLFERELAKAEERKEAEERGEEYIDPDEEEKKRIEEEEASGKE